MSYTPLELSRRAAAYLAEQGIENARLEAELLLAHVLGLKRLDLYLQHDRPLTAAEAESFRLLVRRRRGREPIQYITGTAQFRELTLAVDRRVLIPRPETEILVGEVLRWSRDRPGASGLTALDVGTGSGAIALSLAKEGPFAAVVATDISPDALALAAENARRAGVDDRVELRSGPGFEPLGAGERFDVVVSNPPYIGEPERASLPPEVREWEPGPALFAGDDGMAVLRELIGGAGAHLSGGGLLALEVGAGQATRVVAETEATGAYRWVRTALDLSGRERVVLAERRALANEAQKGQHSR